MPDDLTTNHVRRAIAGENASLEWLVERLAPLLVAQARYRLGTFAGQLDPEDVVHDAWVVTLPRLPDLIARGGRLTPVLLQFLSTAVTNRVRNLLRSRARHPDAGPIVDPTAVRSGVVTQALRNERAAAIHGAIAELDDKDREVLLLRAVEQVTAKVAAMIVGASEVAVQKRYERALQRLRGRLPGSIFDELQPPGEP
ncbi:MAG: sigma-70 family RNA polymerase sigma factor [Planctomycetes bacterium]|nr:sigma-70 family RNA polymerase sigma factor [Planctomycetota bacterium]